MDLRATCIGPMVLCRNNKSAAINACAKELLRILRMDSTSGATVDFLLARLRKRFGKGAPSLSQCLRLLETQPAIECVADGIYRVRLPYLRFARDRIERVLRDQGKILHYREIAAKEIAISKKRSEWVRQIMSHDRRFVPVSRSGFWGLAEWKIETGSIADVAAKAMCGRKGPCTEAEIFDLVHARRPCAPGSIASTLVADGRFRRTKPGSWKLA